MFHPPIEEKSFGGKRIVLDIGERLRSGRHEVIHLVIGGQEKAGAIRRRVRLLFSGPGLISKLSEFRGRAALLHDINSPLTSGYVRTICRLMDMKVINIVYEIPMRDADSIYGARYLRSSLGRSDQIIAMSRNIYTHLCNAGIPPHQIRLAPMPIDTSCRGISSDRNVVGGELRFDPHQILILVGRDSAPWSGIDTFLAAFSLVLREHPGSFALLSLRDFDVRERMEKVMTLMGKLSVVHNVSVVGPTADFLRLLASADLYVIPARSPFHMLDTPLSALESIFLGTPVVSTRVADLPLLITQSRSGCLTDPDDPEGLAKAILELIDDPVGLKKRGKRGKRYVSRFHAWPRFLVILERLVSGFHYTNVGPETAA